MFKIGDKVAYPMHGAAVIKNIENISDSDGTNTYYELEPCLGKITIKVPVTTAEKLGIRPIIKESEADELICSFASLSCIEESNWNIRYRNNLSILKSGNLTEIAVICKTLILRDKKKSLSNAERKMLSQAKSILISELLMSKNMTYDDIEAMLTDKIS